MRSLGLLLGCAVLVLPAQHFAFAMGIRTTRTLLARGASGATLYEIREDGPEGGGALGYRLQVEQPQKNVVDFKVSSDFSPGGSSRPQTITAAVCAERLAALAALVTKHQIPGVTLHPERCQNKEREGLVVVNHPAQAEPSSARPAPRN